MGEDIQVRVPDIGGTTNVEVIEIMVNAGDSISVDQPLITLESEKAAMDIPSPMAGKVEEICLKLGDKVSEGSVILRMTAEQKTPSFNDKTPKEKEQIEKEQIENEPASVPQQTETVLKTHKNVTFSNPASRITINEGIHAGPAARRMARELGIDLSKVQGTGRKNRISKEDLQNYVKDRLSESGGGDFALPKAPVIDFSQFGTIESKLLTKIKRLTGLNVHRSWLNAPQVTQFDEADITSLEEFRKQEIARAKNPYKLTILAFVTKVIAKALAVFPHFNASLDARGENLILKHYFHIGIAVDTENGLVVPVIKNVDRLSVGDIANEMERLSAKARNKGLMPNEMSGGCFTISSLGGIGGTAFTPIVNVPEVAILGLSRASMKPVYFQDSFIPRLLVPLSLSYDHRVIDGAEAARFTRFVADSLSEIRRILL